MLITEQTDFEHCRAQIQTFYCEQASTESVTLLGPLIFDRTNRKRTLSDSTMPDETSEPEATEKKRAHWTVFPNGNGT